MTLASFMILGLWLATASTFAQSYFLLKNNWPYDWGPNAPVFDWAGNRLRGPQWRVELYGGPASDSLSPAVDYRTRERTMIQFQSPGFFDSTSASGHLVIGTVPRGDWAWLQVRVWSVELGATYEEALALGLGGYGESPLFYALGTDPGALQLPAPLLGLQSFTVRQIVPEPSTWALLTIGGLGLWWARRTHPSWNRSCSESAR